MSDVEAGKAHIKTYVDNSALVKGLRASEGFLKSWGSRIASIGARMTGVGDAIGLTVGKEFAGKIVKVIAGATIGAAIAAPLASAFSKIFNSGAANGLIVELVKLRNALAVIFESLTNALLPPLTAALRIITGIVGGTAAWINNHRALITTGAQVASTVVSIGASLALIGKTLEIVGGGFGLVAKIVPAIAAFLATPLGMTLAIGAAIGGAVYAWMRFTDSGKAAAKFLLDFFSPAIKFITQLVGGIGDALMAGDLALAGQIALKGLQIVFLTGVQAITQAMGQTFGTFFGSVATDLIEGQFSRAWETALTGLAAAWDGVAAGIVQVFSAAIGQIAALWNGLANQVTGAVSAFAVVAQLKGFNGLAAKLNQLNNGFTQIVAPTVSGGLAAGTTASSALAESLKQKAAASAARFGGRIAGDDGKVDRELAADKAELAALIKKAAKERAGIKTPELPGSQEVGKVAVGFSGAALALQLQGGNASPQKQLLDEAKKQRDLLADAAASLKTIIEKLKPFGFGA